MTSPWVETAVVRRVLPGTLDVVVARARCRWASPGSAATCIWSTSTAWSSTSTARPTPTSTCRSSTAWPRRRATARRWSTSGARRWSPGCSATSPATSTLASRLSQIDVRDADDAVVLLDGDTVMLRLGDRDFAARLQGYLDVAAGAEGPRRGDRHGGPALRRTDVRAAARRRQRRARARVAGDGRGRTDGRAVVARNERYIVGLDIGTSKVCTRRGRGDRRRRPRRHRHRPGRVEGAEARRRRQPRSRRRLDQEVGRGGRADGRRRDRLGAPGDERPAHQGLQQPRRRRRGRQEPRDHPRGRAPRHRRRPRRVAAGRPRGAARAAAGLRRRRAGRHRRAGRA